MQSKGQRRTAGRGPQAWALDVLGGDLLPPLRGLLHAGHARDRDQGSVKLAL